jgi:hypothetical protein
MSLAAIAVAVLALGSAQAAVKPTEKTTNLPAVWQQAGPQERLKALRVAELDATRLLIERVYGTHVTSDTTVQDLALSSDQVGTAVQQTIRGVTNTEAPEYREDGQVWVVRAVKLRQVLETITRTIKHQQTWTGRVTVEQIEKVERENRDTVIDVTGNGALPNSDGLKKIQAKRAAEIDAYRKLAERLIGVHVTSSTTVKDFVLESDEIRARAAAIIKGAKPTKIEYETTDGSCEVTMQVKIADIFEVIRHYSKKVSGQEQEIIKVEREYETKTFTETGHGAPRAEGFAGDVMKSSSVRGGEAPFAETEVVIKRLVGQGIVVD